MGISTFPTLDNIKPVVDLGSPLLSPFRGNTSTEASSDILDYPVKLKSYNISNQNAGVTVVNIYITHSEVDISIGSKNLTLDEGDYVKETDIGLVLDVGDTIKITTNNSVDYFFTLEKINLG